MDDHPAWELVFGPAARALAARAVPVPPLAPDSDSPPWDRDTVRVRFRRDALAPSDIAELSELATARLGESRGGVSSLECHAADLAELARANAVAARLFEAHANATRPPAPPTLMGVINATPDSFSDGGRFLDPRVAADEARTMVAFGARMLDVGGESTRPGAEAVRAADELERVLPVIDAIRRAGVAVPISIDTRKAEVAALALDRGASTVNDVSAGRDDPEMLPLVAERGAGFVAMHMLGTPRDMQRSPSYEDPVREITEWLRERVAACLQAGIALPNIALDPGIGFGKRVQDNVALIRRLAELRSLGLPLVYGVSRKSFLGALTGVDAPADRAGASAAAVALCIANGADILRVHDVALMAQVAPVAAAHAGVLDPARTT
jgi:dihydropteroate synthase